MQYPNYFGQTFSQGQPLNTNNNQYSDMNMPQSLPEPMSGDMTENNLYPFETPYNNPQANNNTYASGGRVKSKKKKSFNVLPSLAEIIRQHGNNEDSILAHINPLEAHILKNLGGSGTINKATGLPQFSIFSKPGKALRSSAGSGVGALLGNMVLPGVGGIVGGALGQGLQHQARGKSFSEGLLKGGAFGASLPSIASLAGSGASSLGYDGLGQSLNNYGDSNSVLQALGVGGKSTSDPSSLDLFSHAKSKSGFASSLGSKAKGDAEEGLLSKFFSDPKNLLASGVVASSFINKPKKERKPTPEQTANEEKRYLKAMMLSPAERAAIEADKLAEIQMERRIALNQYLPEERFKLTPKYRKVLTPAEYNKHGKWFEYYDNPNFVGKPVPMKKGGRVPKMLFEEIQITSKPKQHDGVYLHGESNGQKDDVEILASNGEYIIPADAVSHQGDGNSIAGGKWFDRLVKDIRKNKMGKTTLPPKAKSIAHYMSKR